MATGAKINTLHTIADSYDLKVGSYAEFSKTLFR